MDTVATGFFVVVAAKMLPQGTRPRPPGAVDEVESQYDGAMIVPTLGRDPIWKKER